MRYVADLLFAFSVFFAFAGVVGMLRMPDTFSRMQSSTNIGTLGVLGVIIGGVMYAIWQYGDYSMAVKIGVLGVLCASIGSIQVNEAIKLLVGIGDPAVGEGADL